MKTRLLGGLTIYPL